MKSRVERFVRPTSDRAQAHKKAAGVHCSHHHFRSRMRCSSQRSDNPRVNWHAYRASCWVKCFILLQIVAECMVYRSSAVITISTATLADIYGTHERGTKMGIFFAAPLLGPALGPIIGGCLAQTFGWPAIFYFPAACGSIILMAFIFLFKDTFRMERSLTYQAALCKRKNARGKPESVVESTTVESKAGTEKHAGSNSVSPPTGSAENKTGTIKADSGLSDIRLSFADINPFPPFWMIVRRKNNIAILLANGECYKWPSTV